MSEAGNPFEDELPAEPSQDAFSWRLTSVTFSGGDTIELPEAGLCIFIGPNSSGKSSALRAIKQHIAEDRSSPVITEVAAERAGTVEALSQWLDERFPKRTFGGRQQWSVKGQNLDEESVGNIWSQGPMMPGAQGFLAHLLDTDSRLSAAKRTRSINLYEQAPEQYIHMLQADDELAARVSREVRETFQTDVLIEWTGGQEVGFRVGTEPPRGEEIDRVSPEYANALLALSRLDQEGDGLRSFTGALLAVRCGAHPVLLIDEPEAFLHPPQARRLGGILARAASERSRQVIIATHSADVVRGALDAPTDVSVCRITREGNLNRASLLRAADLRSLWSKPLLRSVSAISGLFHRGVVVSEADADVRFYDTVLSGLEARGEVSSPTDFHFTQGGGKGELSTLAGAYRAVSVPVAVIADLDLVKNRTELQNVLVALGHDFAPYEGRYNSLMSSLGTLPPQRSVPEFLAEARQALSEIEPTQSAISGAQKKALVDLVDQSTDWSDVKRQGVALLRGGQRIGAEELLAEWENLGLFLVPVGELEGWWPQGPTTKRDWIDHALSMAFAGTLTEASSFVRRVVAFLENARS